MMVPSASPSVARASGVDGVGDAVTAREYRQCPAPTSRRTAATGGALVARGGSALRSLLRPRSGRQAGVLRERDARLDPAARSGCRRRGLPRRHELVLAAADQVG